MKKLSAPQITFFAMLVVLILTFGLSVGGVWYGQKMLKKRSEKVVELKIKNETLDKQQAVYEQARRDVEKYKYYGEVADQVLPKDKDLATVTKELVTISGEFGINIASITYPVSNVGASAAPTTGTPKTSSSLPSTSSLTQTKPVEGLSGVLAVEVNVTPENSISYTNFLAFLDRLSQNRRKLQVTRVGLSTDKEGLITFSLTLNLFVKP